jgi:uncharacterized membrane protein
MRYLIALLALAGAVVSGLALRIHFMDPGAAPPCAVSEHWDCGSVNHSKYSVFPPLSFDEKPGKIHIPVAALGVAGYLAIGVAAGFGRLWIAVELAQIGFFFAGLLTFIEAYILETWCIYCVWSQAIITAVLLTTIVALVMRRRRRVATGRPVLVEREG